MVCYPRDSLGGVHSHNPNDFWDKLSFRVTRRYEDFSRVYLVECPEGMNKAVMMKLIDIHSNRLGGGCVLAKRGEIRGGSTRWEKDR